ALVAIGPATVERRTAQAHDRFDAREIGGIERAGDGVPTDLVGSRGLAADEPEDVVPLRAQRGTECRADKTGCATDRDFHATSLHAWPRRETVRREFVTACGPRCRSRRARSCSDSRTACSPTRRVSA